ncbi:MAG: methylated-DNA--[protein]-cysteine S-methyltransferase [Oceanospirillaceae bacterium]|nr:methylated-DNA--[protein]-cysteine S-methyltransferase [Oceanospirillaceae bacterium]
MMSKQPSSYYKIAEAIDYLHNNFKQQPSLAEIASSVHLSPFHFQRMFSDWAGVSPKKFMQFLSVEYAKDRLKNHRESLLETALQTGLSGPSRLHDLFVTIEGMTPGQYKQAGLQLVINYYLYPTVFGEVLIASTLRGVCHVGFVATLEEGVELLAAKFQQAQLQHESDALQQAALKVFQHDWSAPYTPNTKVKLHLKGTDFQLKVWQALLSIPVASLATYGQLATSIGTPKASRAVGTAISNNPVAFLIPCHRVIRATGHFGEYRWGSTRKSAMIGWEAAQHYG